MILISRICGLDINADGGRLPFFSFGGKQLDHRLRLNLKDIKIKLAPVD